MAYEFGNVFRQTIEVSRREPMQTRTHTTTGEPKARIVTTMAVHDIYIHPVNVPATYPGEMTAKFKPISSNSSFHFKSVSPNTMQDDSVLSHIRPLHAPTRAMPYHWDFPQ